MSGIYVASRASIPERSAMWRGFRDQGYPIISSWVDEAGENETDDFGELWERIVCEITASTGLVLFAKKTDFPLKGAFVEVGMALAFNKRIVVVLDFEPEDCTFKPVGSWLAHRNVRRAETIQAAFHLLNAHPGQYRRET